MTALRLGLIAFFLSLPASRILYPLHPGRRADMPWSRWWDDAPPRPQGPHDGKPRPR